MGGSEDLKARRIGLVGGGNMAGALVRGLLESEVAPARLRVAEPVEEKREALREVHGIDVVAAASELDGADLFATIAGLAGVEISEVHDSRSFTSLLVGEGTHRDFAYSAIEDAEGVSRAVRDRRYKLILGPNGEEELFDLLEDPYEQVDLVAAGLDDGQARAVADMKGWLSGIEG